MNDTASSVVPAARSASCRRPSRTRRLPSPHKRAVRGVLVGQPEEHAACMCVVVRRTFATEIRQEQRRTRRLCTFGARGEHAGGRAVRARASRGSRRPTGSRSSGASALRRSGRTRARPHPGSARSGRCRRTARPTCRATGSRCRRPSRPCRSRRPRCRRRRRRSSARDAPFAPQRVAQLRGGRVAFDEARHLRARQLGRGEHPVGPVAACAVEPACPTRRTSRTRIRRTGARSGSPSAAAPCAPRGTRRPYFASHSSFGAVKPGIAMLPVIARDSGTSASARRTRCRRACRSTGSRGAALVRAIDQRRAVHLPRERDAAQRGEAGRMRGAHRRDCVEHRVPPRLRPVPTSADAGG